MARFAISTGNELAFTNAAMMQCPAHSSYLVLQICDGRMISCNAFYHTGSIVSANYKQYHQHDRIESRHPRPPRMETHLLFQRNRKRARKHSPHLKLRHLVRRRKSRSHIPSTQGRRRWLVLQQQISCLSSGMLKHNGNLLRRLQPAANVLGPGVLRKQ